MAAVVLVAAAGAVWRINRIGDAATSSSLRAANSLGQLGSWRSASVGLASLGWATALYILFCGASVLAPVYSGITLVDAIEQQPRNTPIYSVGTYDQTVPFYLQRTVTLVHYRGELDYGLRHDPDRGIADLEAFLVRWRNESNALAIMEPQTFAALQAQHMPMKLLARDEHRLVVSRSSP
jgi:hypothetical protein